ncbi:MAG: ATP-binding cassette domain-containing protein [Thermoproteota archaeon]
MESDEIIKVCDLVKYFPVYVRSIIFRKQIGVVHAVDHVSFTIRKGETLGLVGESGSGKTTVGKTILYLIPPTSGQIFFNGMDVNRIFKEKDKKKILEFRRNVQMIFQNPYGSLNPRMTVYDIIAEPFRTHKHVPKKEWEERVYKLLKMVGLEEYHAERYPHEFSGGQRQRICIARAIAVEPQLIVADEPVSSLDVSVRAQILNLLQELQIKQGLSYLYISHDLSSVRQISHKVAVMYLGQIVELAATDELYSHPLHPYTMALLSAIPIPDPEKKMARIVLPGEVPSAINPPPGCRFHLRCKYAIDKCKNEEPKLRELRSDHFVACHLAENFL